MDLKAEVKEVERELVEVIIKHLQENKIEVEKARQLSRDFLALLPINDQRDLLIKLKNLGEKYDEVKEIYAKELSKTNEQIRDTALSQMRDFIKQGKLDSAINVAKSLPTVTE